MSGRTRTRLLLAGLTAAALAAITGVISYRHGLDVVRMVGNSGLVAYLVPLVPDLMIITSSLTLMEASALREPRPAVAMVALVAGIGWTVAVNIAAGWRGGPGGALIAAGIPLAFVLTFEALLWLVRRGRGSPVAAGAPATSTPCPHTVALSGEEAAVMAYHHALECLGERLSYREIERRFGVKRDRVAELASPPAPEPVLNGQVAGD